MKKILSLILAGLMTLSCAAFVGAEDAAAETAQIPAAQARAIEFLKVEEIMHGKSTEEFDAAATDAVTRYEMAVFAARMATGWTSNDAWENNTANDSPFEDLAGTAAEGSLGAISYASEMGLVEGYSAKKFGPMDGVTYRDALKMVLSAMGYKGLSYPWGYIETAVELDLTKGVDAETYTTALNRGQVAVIIYNALFAECKNGETLAEQVFDRAYGWVNIAITASDLDTFKGSTKKAPAGYVEFQIIDDGELVGNSYYVKASELGLGDGHADDLAVGHVYYALLATEGDKIVGIEKYDACVSAPIYNMGNDYANIAAALNGYVPTNKAHDYKYLDTLDNQLTMYSLQGRFAYTVKPENVTIEQGTFNLLYKGEVAWYYSPVFDNYFRYVVDASNTNVYVEWMTEEVFGTWFVEALKEQVAGVGDEWKVDARTLDKFADLYAKLVMFDADGDTKADMAMYKDYTFGTVGTANCAHGKAMYTINGAAVAEKDACNDCALVAGWINTAIEGYVPSGSYVLYNFNDTTGEIEVIKEIKGKLGEGADADSGTVTGILNGYSTTNGKLYIDGVGYDIGYKALKGQKDLSNLAFAAYEGAADAALTAAKVAAAATLDELYLQYVTIQLVDNRVIDIDAVNGSLKDLIVVQAYAGITPDGYMAVYGYTTSNAKLSVLKLASVNGWKRGDYYYNPENIDADGIFNAGRILEIRSINADGAYGVYTEEESNLAFTGLELDFYKNYRVVDKTTTKAMADTDTYIVIVEKTPVIFVKTGVIAGDEDAFDITTDKAIKVSDNKFILFVKNIDAAQGFGETGYNIGFVLYDKNNGRVWDAYYDEQAAVVNNSWLLGASYSNVRVTNLLTGAIESTVVGNNIDLKNGHVYMTIEGQIIKVLDTCGDFLASIDTIYSEKDVENAKYMVLDLTDLVKADFGAVGKNDDKDIQVKIAKAAGIITGSTDPNEAKVEAIIAKAAIGTMNGLYVINTADPTETLTAATLADNTKYTAKVVLEVATGNYVVYLGAGVNTAPVADKTVSDTIVAENGKWLYDEDMKTVEATFEITANGTAKYDRVAGAEVFKSATVKELVLNFNVAVEGTHADIAANGYLFGGTSEHGLSLFGNHNSYAKVWSDANGVTIENAKEVTVDGMTLVPYATDCCEMVKTVKLALPEIVLEEGEVVGIEFEIDGETVEVGGFADGNEIAGVIYVWVENGQLVVEEIVPVSFNDGALNKCFPVHSDLGIVESLIG